MKSLILELINAHEDDWVKYCKILGIKVKIEGDLAIFNYGAEADFFNPIVREARGIIIDVKDKKVVCWPFEKWFNANEQYAENTVKHYDFAHCRVEEKIDGSLMKVWFYLGAWRVSTNSCIDAKSAKIKQNTMNFLELFTSAANYKSIQWDKMMTNCTYMFELISPINQIVIKYPTTSIYHIGTRNNETGEELIDDIGIVHPKQYQLTSLEDCVKAAAELNINDNNIRHEGFVVVDQNWSRLKVKSPEYVSLHRLSGNGDTSKAHIIEMIMTSTISIDELCKDFPYMAVYFKYYDYKMTEFKHYLRLTVEFARGLYEEYDHNRKSVVNELKNSPLFSLAMKSLGNNKSVDELIDEIAGKNIPYYKSSKYLKYIDEYQERCLS